jgi:hypothetical protein
MQGGSFEAKDLSGTAGAADAASRFFQDMKDIASLNFV